MKQKKQSSSHNYTLVFKGFPALPTEQESVTAAVLCFVLLD